MRRNGWGSRPFIEARIRKWANDGSEDCDGSEDWNEVARREERPICARCGNPIRPDESSIEEAGRERHADCGADRP